jgi:hypothetical protein
MEYVPASLFHGVLTFASGLGAAWLAAFLLLRRARERSAAMVANGAITSGFSAWMLVTGGVELTDMAGEARVLAAVLLATGTAVVLALIAHATSRRVGRGTTGCQTGRPAP